MAKPGLDGVTRHLAMERADHQIRINRVAPAGVVTPICGDLIEPERADATLPAGNGSHPVGRVGRPTDVGAVIGVCPSPVVAGVASALG